MSRISERKSDIHLFRTNHPQSQMQTYLSSSLSLTLETEK